MELLVPGEEGEAEVCEIAGDGDEALAVARHSEMTWFPRQCWVFREDGPGFGSGMQKCSWIQGFCFVL